MFSPKNLTNLFFARISIFTDLFKKKLLYVRSISHSVLRIIYLALKDFHMGYLFLRESLFLNV